ncbi:MAG: response regulator [Ketobacter sp.]|nr:MAG: response regulator [Ketobacter sp.]
MNTIKPLVILLAEDNIDHAELIVETLQDFNLTNTVFHVTNGEEVIKFLKCEGEYNTSETKIPDLILLDLKMPRMDGTSALQWIKSEPQFRHLPVVMLSTSHTEQEIQNCYRLGANSYLTKPLQFDDFIKKIKDLNFYWVLTSEIPHSE